MGVDRVPACIRRPKTQQHKRAPGLGSDCCLVGCAEPLYCCLAWWAAGMRMCVEQHPDAIRAVAELVIGMDYAAGWWQHNWWFSMQHPHPKDLTLCNGCKAGDIAVHVIGVGSCGGAPAVCSIAQPAIAVIPEHQHVLAVVIWGVPAGHEHVKRPCWCQCLACSFPRAGSHCLRLYSACCCITDYTKLLPAQK